MKSWEWRRAARRKYKLDAFKIVNSRPENVQRCLAFAEMHTTTNHHAIVMHYIAQITFFGNGWLLCAFYGRMNDNRQPRRNTVLVSIYHTLTRYKANQ